MLEVQKKSVAAAAAMRFSLLFDDMGLGKTAQALAIDILNRNQNTLIFCPNNVKKVWLHEIEKFTGIPSKKVFIGSGADIITLPASFALKYRYIIFNYEALVVAYKTPKAPTPGIFTACTHHILDEAHNFRNPRTQRFRAYLKFLGKGSVKNLTVLTGTPIDRCINEVWPYMAMLDSNPSVKERPFLEYFSNFSKFSDRYAILANQYTKQGHTVAKHKGYRKNAVHEIENMMGRKAIQRKIEDVVELPKVHKREIFLLDNLFEEDMAKISYQFKAAFMNISKSKKLYNDFIAGKTDDGRIAAAQAARVKLAKEKVKWTYDMAVKYLKICDKIIIFSEFIEPLKMFESLAKTYRVKYAIGRDMKLSEREKSVEEFKEGGADFLLATFGALSEGENLQKCQCMIMNDLPWQPLVITQASRRIWRIGQEKECHIVQMTCSADNALKKILENKQEMVRVFEGQLANIKEEYGYL